MAMLFRAMLGLGSYSEIKPPGVGGWPRPLHASQVARWGSLLRYHSAPVVAAAVGALGLAGARARAWRREADGGFLFRANRCMCYSGRITATEVR